MDLGSLAAAGLSHLVSPAALALEDTEGRWRSARHLKVIDEELVRIAFTEDPEWTLVNLPFQHGKTTLCSIYFLAWYLLLFPHRRVVLVSLDDDFAAQFGMKVKDVVAKFGPPLGVELREDTKAKGEWLIRGYDGGMVCRGPGGGVVGRPADLFLIDDLLRNAQQALSKVVLQGHWDFFQTVVYGRLRRRTKLFMIGTRWSKRDLFGRVLGLAAENGIRVRHIKFRAIAGQDDPLGRRPGEALWPEQVTLAQLQVAQRSFPWFNAAWQQEPDDEESGLLRPSSWPVYTDIVDAYSIVEEGVARRVWLKSECMVLVAADWAYSVARTADYTAIGTFALTPDGRLLILEVVNRRLRLEEFAPELAGCCRHWRPSVVAVESGHPTLAREVERYPEIPPVMWMSHGSKDKLVRAVDAIMAGQASPGRIVMPAVKPAWASEFISQVGGFTGVDDEHDDIVDMLSWAAKAARAVRGGGPIREDCWPELLIEGRNQDEYLLGQGRP